MSYVDGFVIPVPAGNLKAYVRMARKAGKIWCEYGALEYRECVGDDLENKFGIPFPKGFHLKPGEVVLFSWIVFKSKAHRNRVNAQVLKDPRLNCSSDPNGMPFDCKRMAYGGFRVLVDL